MRVRPHLDLDAAMPASDDDDKVASPGIRGMLNAAEPASGPSSPELSMRFRPHLDHCIRGAKIPHGDQSIASYVRSLIGARWTPRRGSRFSVGRGSTGIPSDPVPLLAGVITRDNPCPISRSASSRLRELISLPNVHCEIVHGSGSDFEGAGCVTHPASEISLEDSCPTHLGCMLGLMSAEQIRQDLRSPL